MERPDTDIAEVVRRVELFEALRPWQLATLIDSTRPVRLGEGERLFDRGQPARRFFYLLAGQLKLFRNSPTGGEKVIEIVHPGETFAEAVMFLDPDHGYPASAEAIDASELLGFDSVVVRGMLHESVETCLRMLASLSRRLHRQVDEVEKLALHPAGCRLAAYLLEQLPSEVPVSPEIRLTAPKHVIASRLGIQPETFSRTVARLVKDGLIAVRGRDVVLLDVEGLRERAGP